MISQWNNVVKVDDTVYHLGDLFMLYPSCSGIERALEIIEQLNGTIIIIPGNHDIDLMEKLNKKELLPTSWSIIDEGNEAPGERLGTFEIDFDAFVSWCSHKPLELYPDFIVGLHAHTHSKHKTNMSLGKTVIHVGVDAWDFTPVSIEQIIKLISETSSL